MNGVAAAARPRYARKGNGRRSGKLLLPGAAKKARREARDKSTQDTHHQDFVTWHLQPTT
jgi:hypothetical protein